jgi:hypothetical protein
MSYVIPSAIQPFIYIALILITANNPKWQAVAFYCG